MNPEHINNCLVDTGHHEVVPEILLKNGSPLWMVFLKDPSALSITPEEAHLARNTHDAVKAKYPEAINRCNGQEIEECIHVLNEVGVYPDKII
jgi:hypothetical protein